MNIDKMNDDMDGFGTNIADRPTTKSRGKHHRGGGGGAPPRQQQQQQQNEVQQQRIKKGECPKCGQKTHKVNVLTRKRTPLTIEGKCLAGTCLNCNQIMPRGAAAAAAAAGAPGAGGGNAVPGAPLGVVELSTTRGVIPSEDELSVVSGLTMEPDLLRMHSLGLGGKLRASEKPENYLKQPALSALTEEDDDGEVDNAVAQLDRRQGLGKSAGVGVAAASGRAGRGRGRPIGRDKQPSRQAPNLLSGYDTGSSVGDSFDARPTPHYFGERVASEPRLRQDLTGSSNRVMDMNVQDSDRDLAGFDAEDLRWSASSTVRDTANENSWAAAQPIRNSTRSNLQSNNNGIVPGSYEDVRARIASRYASGAGPDSEGKEGRRPLHYDLDSDTNDRAGNDSAPKKTSRDKSIRSLRDFDPPSIRSGLSGITDEDMKVEIDEEPPLSRSQMRSYSPANDTAAGSMTSAEIREIEDAFEVLEKPSLVSWRSGFSSSEGKFSVASRPSTPKQTEAAAAAAAPGISLQQEPATDDAPVILYCLNSYPNNQALHEKAFNALFTLATATEERCKDEIIANDGVKSIVDGLWRHMESSTVQEAGLYALWALAVSKESGSGSAGASCISQGRAIDAILISMQTHLHQPAIQHAGCGVLSCLAHASTQNRDIDDGTSSGAMYNIVTAMYMHSTNTDVQEWGIRALYHECESSDTNKVNFTKTGDGGLGDGGRGGVSSVFKAMKRFPDDIRMQEWGCRLINCISSHSTAAKEMSVTVKPIELIVDAISSHRRNTRAINLCEEGCGALSNFSALMEQNNGPMRSMGAVKTVVNVMMFYPRSERIQVLACRVLANLAPVKESREAMLRSNTTKIVLSAMRSFSACAALQEEACRLLRALCAECNDSRDAVFDSAGLPAVVRAMTKHTDSKGVQEMGAGTLAGMAVNESRLESIASPEVIGTIAKTMINHPQEKTLQEVCCIALRNISTYPGGHDTLMLPDHLDAIVGAMVAHGNSEIVQENACGIIWNLSAGLARDPMSVLSAGEVKYVVQAMQNHPESAWIQEAACGTLWSLATSSEDVRNSVVSEGGIDAIMCALLMHEYETKVLEMACGILSSLSVNQSVAKSIANSGCIGTVVELMRNNISSSAIVQSTCLLLRNMACFDTNYAEEASAACSTIVRSMQEHSEDANLNKEACGAIASLAAHSETCKERILLLSGIATVNRAKEHFDDDVEVATEAKAALLQLSSST